MRRAFLLVVCLVVSSISLSAQDSLWSYVMRCAVVGAHLDGCTLSDLSCTYQQHLDGTCGASVPAPPAGITAPTELRDIGTGIVASHDGALTDWYTLHLDGAYHAHVSMDALSAGTVTLPLGILESGTYSVTVLACSDAAGCVRSAPLEIQR